MVLLEIDQEGPSLVATFQPKSMGKEKVLPKEGGDDVSKA